MMYLTRDASLLGHRVRRHLRAVSLLAVLGTLVLLLAACGNSGSSNGDDISDRTINAVATTGMIGDIAGRVGGDRVEVSVLMGAGVDPHLYRASEGDLRTLERADVIFYNGLHLEGGMSTVLEQMGERARTEAVAEAIPREQLLSSPDFEGSYDPHVWFDVSLWMLATEHVRDTLIEVDPGHRTDYEERTIAYLAELTELDEYVRAQAERIPVEQRVLVTAHDAFGYFGRAYAFEVHGLQGISTATEAGTRDVQQLADFVTERQIPAIFVESSVPRRTVEAVQEAVQSRGWVVQIGGELYSDAMGDAGTPEGTYIGMVRANIDTITSALLGETDVEA